jgi:hypothetical protein
MQKCLLSEWKIEDLCLPVNRLGEVNSNNSERQQMYVVTDIAVRSEADKKIASRRWKKYPPWNAVSIKLEGEEKGGRATKTKMNLWELEKPESKILGEAEATREETERLRKSDAAQRKNSARVKTKDDKAKEEKDKANRESVPYRVSFGDGGDGSEPSAFTESEIGLLLDVVDAISGTSGAIPILKELKVWAEEDLIEYELFSSQLRRLRIGAILEEDIDSGLVVLHPPAATTLGYL